MKKLFLSLIGVTIAVAATWSVIFYWQHLRGAKVAISPPTEDIVKTINTTGMPLILPPGFSIEILAKDLPNARVLVFDSEGNAWVSQPKKGLLTFLEIKDGKVVSQNAVYRNLRKPHGLAFDPEASNILYVATEDAILKLRLASEARPEKIIDLPSGGNHTSRTIGFGPDGRLYVSIGSTCNVCHEKDNRRAKIFSLNKDGSDFKEYARGLRNSVFFIWQNSKMWATDMGRDLLGDDLPPDEINIVEAGKNYGWPICYGQNIHDTDFDKNTYIRNPCMAPFEQPSLIDLQAHSAPLGLAFLENKTWPKEYQGSLFVAYHGSWNRTTPTGYMLVRIPFDSSGASLPPVDFVTGWLKDGAKYGRPVDIVTKDEAMYVTDDSAGVVYKITYTASVERPAVPKKPACRPSGCSGEICADEEVFTTCIYKEEFACYKKAKCERQKDGQCAWTLTQELLQCLGGRL